MSHTDHERAPLSDRLDEDAHNVLLLAPPLDSGADAACTDLLIPPSADRPNLLFVTLTRSPDNRLERWRAHGGGEPPVKLGFVAAGASTRSAVETEATPGPKPGVETVSTPGDLTGLGIKTSQRLEAWAADGNPTMLCFDSLTALLQYADLEPAFQFFHVLTSRVRIAGARAHYHADPSAHDERTLNTMRSLFDAVVEWQDGDWVVTSR